MLPSVSLGFRFAVFGLSVLSLVCLFASYGGNWGELWLENGVTATLRPTAVVECSNSNPDECRSRSLYFATFHIFAYVVVVHSRIDPRSFDFCVVD